MDVNVAGNARGARALGLGLSHVAVAVLLQIEIGLVLFFDGAFDAEHTLSYLAWLPVTQFSVVIVGVLVGLLAWASWGRRATRGLMIIAVLLANLYLCLAQLFFLAVGEPFEAGFLRDANGVADVAATVGQRIGPLFYLNVVVALTAVAGALRWSGPFEALLRAGGGNGARQGFTVVAAGLLLVAGSLSPYASIAVHPVYRLVESVVDSNAAQRQAQLPIWNVFGVGFGSPADPSPVGKVLAQTRCTHAATLFVFYSYAKYGAMLAEGSAAGFTRVHLPELSTSAEALAHFATAIVRRIESIARTPIMPLAGNANATLFSLDLTAASPAAFRAVAGYAASRDRSLLQAGFAATSAIDAVVAGKGDLAIWFVGLPDGATRRDADNPQRVLWKEQDSALRLTLYAKPPRREAAIVFQSPLSFDEVFAAYLQGHELRAENIYFRARGGGIMWGVRDGQWKFLAGHYGNGARLFDLANDPFELRNLAPHYPRRVDFYQRLLASRYTTFGGPQRALLIDDGYVDDRPPSRSGEFGPKSLKVMSAKAKRWWEKRWGAIAIGPNDTPVMELALLPYGSSETLVSQWAGPSGERAVYAMRVDQRWSVYRFTPTLSKPLSPGQWQVVVKLGDEAVIGGDFYVEDPAAPRDADSQQYTLLKRTFDKSTAAMTLTEASVFDPYDLPRVGGIKVQAATQINTEWWPPSGEPLLGTLAVGADGHVYPGPRPLAPGRWRVKIVDQQGTVAMREFDVRQSPARPATN